MSVLERQAATRPGEFRKHRRGFRLGLEGRESAVVFLVPFVAYTALGWRVVLGQHVVVFDAMSRLAHAYFVWWNTPPKLTAIGFVWPPISTIAFLPAALVKPLATSLLALPLTTAFFAGLMFVFLDRTLKLLELGRRYRFPLLVAFGLNPMIAFYASNGMSEVVYLAFLTGAVYSFLRWYVERRATLLITTGALFAVGVLSRYEVFTWAIVLTGVIGAALIRQHVRREELEGALISFLVPIAYGVGLWLFFNWLILHDALFWLRHQAPGTAAIPPGQSASIQVATAGPPLGARHVAGELLALNWHLFPLTLLVVAGLGLLFLLRRDLMAVTLGVLIALNASFTGLIVYFSRSESYIQLRYNMRAMPLALIGVGWLFVSMRGRARPAVALGALVALLAGLPVTWHTMQTFKVQYLEQAFTRALATGKDQEGTESRGGYGVGIAPQRDLAGYLTRHVHGTDAILTDDAQTFSVMLLSGRPGLFLDRIDKGDLYWLKVLDAPFGRVRYLLASEGKDDLVLQHYPGLRTGALPGLEPVLRRDGFVLVKVAPRPPGRVPRRA